jgi:hypothetical protein
MEKEFLKANQEAWNKQKLDEISQITGLSTSSLYKWNWDQRYQIRQQVKLEEEYSNSFALGIKMQTSVTSSTGPQQIFKVTRGRE